MEVALTSEVRARGARESAAPAVSTLIRREVHGFGFISPSTFSMPPCYRLSTHRSPNGLDYGELHELLVPLLRSATGLEVTIFDPDLDHTDEHVERLTE